MKTREIVSSIMKSNNETNASFATKLGISQAALWDRLNSDKKNELSVTVLLSMLRILEYKIVIVPKDYKVPKKDKSGEPINSYEVG